MSERKNRNRLPGIQINSNTMEHRFMKKRKCFKQPKQDKILTNLSRKVKGINRQKSAHKRYITQAAFVCNVY